MVYSIKHQPYFELCQWPILIFGEEWFLKEFIGHFPHANFTCLGFKRKIGISKYIDAALI